MLSSDFEKEIQQQLGELKFTPDEAVWQNVEASLPEKKRKRFVFFLLFAALVAGGGYYLWETNFNDKNTIAARNEKIHADEKITTVADDKKQAENTTTALTEVNKKNNEESLVTAGENNSGAALHSLKNNPESGNSKTNTASADKVVPVNQNQTKPSAKENVAQVIIEPATESKKGGGEALIAPQQEWQASNSLPVTSLLEKANAPVNVNTEPVALQPTIADERKMTEPVTNEDAANKTAAVVLQADSIAKTTLANDTTTAIAKSKNKKASQWVFGIKLSAGSANIKSNGSGDKALYNDPSNSSSGNVNGNYAGSVAINRTHAFAWAAGLYAEKQVGANWKLQTGIQYAYYSNTQPVGQKVDSAIFYNLNNDVLRSDNFYRNSSGAVYRNKYHYLQVPAIVKYSFAKWPLYLQAGPSVSYLLQSNALQYNSSRNGYFTDAQMFNKWMLSFNGGIGFDFAKNKKPLFSLGYQFSSGLSSTSKTTFGKQRMMSSQFYLLVPINK